MRKKFKATKKCLGALFCVLILTLALFVNVYAQNVVSEGQMYTVQEDGIVYTIEVTENENRTLVKVANNASGDYIIEEIDTKEEKISVTNYKYEGKNIFGRNKYEKSIEEINLEKYETAADKAVSSKAISYNSKKYGNMCAASYYYAYGSDGKKSYIKVGNSSESHSIRTDNLSSSKESNCDSYADYIDLSSSYYAKACAYSVASGVGIGVVAGLVAANVAFPPSVIVTIVIAACGGGSSVIAMVNNLIDSNDAGQKAINMYTKISVY